MNDNTLYLVYDICLTGVVGLVSYVIKEKSDELIRISTLLSQTREEMARDYATKKEVHLEFNRVIDRFDRLDDKIDKLTETLNAVRK